MLEMMEEEKKNWNWREEKMFSYQLQAASCQESSKITGEREREREGRKEVKRKGENGGREDGEGGLFWCIMFVRNLAGLTPVSFSFKLAMFRC